MPQTPPRALALSRKLLRSVITLNLVTGLLILALLVASLVAEGRVFDALGVKPGEGRAQFIMWARVIMVLGILAVPLGHAVLTRLTAIVDSVARGDPFIAANAVRLKAIAWVVLMMELVHLGVVVSARFASSAEQTLDIEWSMSVSRWLGIVLCFVLAHVFEHGTRMRDDLDGTV